MSQGPALFGVLAAGVGVATTVPYIRDTLRGSTIPHRGTWLIWSTLEVVGLWSQHADGAQWSLLPLLAQALGSCLVLALSFRFGNGRLSGAELALMAVAGAGLLGWLVSDEPVIATACVIVADLVAALMMLPKTWREPHSETMATFLLASVGGALTVAAVESVRVSLLMYPVYFTVVNALLVWVILGRRRVLKAGVLHGELRAVPHVEAGGALAARNGS